MAYKNYDDRHLAERDMMRAPLVARRQNLAGAMTWREENTAYARRQTEHEFRGELAGAFSTSDPPSRDSDTKGTRAGQLGFKPR